MHSTPPPWPEAHQALLLQTARESIRHGLDQHRALVVDPAQFPEALRVPAPVFVTLLKGVELRGCIGALESSRPLIANTAHYAHAAAFSDSRFEPVRQNEFNALQIKISILSPLEPLVFSDEADLLRQIQPGVDGLLLEADGYRGTFLPSVWESLPEAAEFLRRLKVKAGLYPDYWSNTLRVSRYTVYYLEEKDSGEAATPPQQMME